jgi:hypothetical protein
MRRAKVRHEQRGRQNARSESPEFYDVAHHRLPLCGCMPMGISGDGLMPGRTVPPNSMLHFWRDPIAAGDPRVAADIKPGDAEAAQQAYVTALQHTSSGKYPWSNPQTGHSGWIEVGAEHYDPGGSRCRDVRQAYALAGVMTGKSFTYCRTEHTGDWAPVVGTGQSFTEPMSS